MAYIQPDATILICQDVPLNASYDDTLTFYDENGNWDYTAQYNYFAGKTTTAMTKENYSVVRERQGVLRVEGHVGLWQKVNYMVFTNNNFGAKHFYAFINKAEYVNPNTTFLYFQIDVMQTWLGELHIENSLIDREHVEDDSLYANLEDEGVEIQERLPYDASFNFEPYIGQKMLVIGSTVNPYDAQGGLAINFDINKVYPYMNIVNYDIDNITILNAGPSTVDTVVEFSTTNNWFTVPLEVEKFSFNVTGIYLKSVYSASGNYETGQVETYFSSICYGEYDANSRTYTLTKGTFESLGEVDLTTERVYFNPSNGYYRENSTSLDYRFHIIGAYDVTSWSLSATPDFTKSVSSYFTVPKETTEFTFTVEYTNLDGFGITVDDVVYTGHIIFTYKATKENGKWTIVWTTIQQGE